MERTALDRPTTLWVASMGILVALGTILARRRHG